MQIIKSGNETATYQMCRLAYADLPIETACADYYSQAIKQPHIYIETAYADCYSQAMKQPPTYWNKPVQINTAMQCSSRRPIL